MVIRISPIHFLYVFVQVGKANGLTLLLDASTYDYTFHRQASEGFKIAVEHHLDQPLMSMKELDITPGFETQVGININTKNTRHLVLSGLKCK